MQAMWMLKIFILLLTHKECVNDENLIENSGAVIQITLPVLELN